MKNRPIYGRIPVDYAPMQDLSIDIKTMPQAFEGYHLLLVITYNQTNFTIAIPLRDRTAQTTAEALIYRVMNKVKRYIEACHTCLKTKPKYMKNQPVYGRIPVDYAPMQDLSIYIKTMPEAFRGYYLEIEQRKQ